jgi:hypothetical protein
MKYIIEKEAFNHTHRGFRFQAWYLKEPEGNALIKISRDGKPIREFLFPAYKIWNIKAHADDIVESELSKNEEGYMTAGSTGLGGNVFPAGGPK